MDLRELATIKNTSNAYSNISKDKQEYYGILDIGYLENILPLTSSTLEELIHYSSSEKVRKNYFIL